MKSQTKKDQATMPIDQRHATGSVQSSQIKHRINPARCLRTRPPESNCAWLIASWREVWHNDQCRSRWSVSSLLKISTSSCWLSTKQDGWPCVTKLPKFRPTIQCHVDPLRSSNCTRVSKTTFESVLQKTDRSLDVLCNVLCMMSGDCQTSHSV